MTPGVAANDEDPELDALVAAYQAAKAEHTRAIKALRAATAGSATPDFMMLRRQGAAAMAEYEALEALRRYRRV